MDQWRRFLAAGLECRSKLLLLYLFTSPHSHTCGLYWLPLGYAACDLGEDEESIVRQFEQLDEAGLAHYDRSTETVYVPRMLEINKPNPKMMINAREHLRDLDSPFKRELVEEYPDFDFGVQVKPKNTVDYQAVVDVYAQENEKLPPIKKLTDSRRRHIRARVRDPEWLERFREAVRMAQSIPFLYGENDRKWRATFDWFIRNDENVIRVLEGKYGKRRSVGSWGNRKRRIS